MTATRANEAPGNAVSGTHSFSTIQSSPHRELPSRVTTLGDSPAPPLPVTSTVTHELGESPTPSCTTNIERRGV